MKDMHWSEIYVSYITVEIVYDNGDRQGWDYDCSQYPNIEAVRENMAEDFASPRLDRENLILYVKRGNQQYSTEVALPELVGDDFVEFVFDLVEEII